MTKVYLLEECHFNGHHDYRTVEVPDHEAEAMIEKDYQQRLEAANEEEKPFIKRRTCQEIVDVYNNDYRASWVKFYRHNQTGMYYTDDEGNECLVIENIADTEPTPSEAYAQEEFKEEIQRFISTLTETQQRRARMLMEGMTTREIAAKEGCDHQRVSKSVDQIRKKYLKFFEK